MIILILNLLLTLLSDSISPNGDKDIDTTARTVKFDIIETSNDSVLQCILKDAVGHGNQTSDCYYILRFGKLNNDTLIKITEYGDSVLNSNMYFIGCILFNGHKVFVDGDDSYKFEFVTPAKYTSNYRKKEKHPSDTKETNESYYYMMDDIYAKLNPSEGWIWSDGKPDE